MRVDWLECQEACLPGKADLSLALPVRQKAEPGPEAARLAAARKELPQADPAWRFAARAAGDSFQLSAKAPVAASVSEAYFYPLAPRVVEHAKPQALAKEPGGFRLALPRDPGGMQPERLQGVLVAKTAAGEQALPVDVLLSASSR